MRNPRTGKPTAEARRTHGANLPGEKAGSFPIWDERSARAALHLRRYAGTATGRERIYQEAARFAPEGARLARERDAQKGIALRNQSQQLRSLQTGRPLAEARRRYGFQGVPGERGGAFPIFDVRSALAAIRLRGRAMTEEGRRNILYRAREFAPGAVRRALEVERRRAGR